jgi:hypothetical protein
VAVPPSIISESIFDEAPEANVRVSPAEGLGVIETSLQRAMSSGRTPKAISPLIQTSLFEEWVPLKAIDFWVSPVWE